MTPTNMTPADYRSALINGLPVAEARDTFAGLETAWLEGGEGPPIILLHGPGENGFWWMRVTPELVASHRVIIPDLPGHGETSSGPDPLEPDVVLRWLDDLIRTTCSSAPVLVGHVLGGSIAARYAARNGEALKRLVLVDSLGLGKFRPAPGFAFRLIRFMIRPTRKNYDLFLPHCLLNLDTVRTEMDQLWDVFTDYNLQNARDPDKKVALRELMQKSGVPQIPSEDLSRIRVPTTLIWGREDRANDLSIAEEAGEQFNWPLHVIDRCGDDPKLDRPEAFVRTLLEVTRPGMESLRASPAAVPANA